MKGIKILALALVLTVAGFSAFAYAQGALTASISSPVSGSSFNVGQTITLIGNATGGTGTYPSFLWSFSDGTQAVAGQNQTVSFGTTGTKTINLAVTDSNGDRHTVSTNVTIAGATTSNPLVISNVQVVNVTKNSATITWTTNRPANSRVIYDIVSHPTVDSNNKPYYAYASSTAQYNNSMTASTTSHSVTVSGLASKTRYYFRVVSFGGALPEATISAR